MQSFNVPTVHMSRRSVVTLNERGCFISDLIYWFELSFVVALQADTRARTFVCPDEPLNPTSVHQIRAEFKPSGERRCLPLVRPAVSDSTYYLWTSHMTTPKYQAGRPPFLTQRLYLMRAARYTSSALHMQDSSGPIGCRLLVWLLLPVARALDRHRQNIHGIQLRCCCDSVSLWFVWKMREVSKWDWSSFLSFSFPFFFGPQFSSYFWSCRPISVTTYNSIL